MKVVFKQKSKRKGVSLWVYILVLIAISSTLAFSGIIPEKKYKTELTLTEWAKGDKWINIAKQALSKSDLPSRDVSMILDSLSEYQNKIVLQVNSQLEADKKLEKPNPDAKKDTTQKKTN